MSLKLVISQGNLMFLCQLPVLASWSSAKVCCKTRLDVQKMHESCKLDRLEPSNSSAGCC